MTADDMLNGWDEIAAFLKCSVTTAWRYERHGGLPVIRLYTGKVCGSKAELRAWVIGFHGQTAPLKELERK